MHRNSGQLTRGRYLRCPPSTPFYPGWHNLGSRDWTSDEREPWPALGEWEGERIYSRGEVDTAFPSPILLGSADCIRNGETESPDPARTFASGFDARCWLVPEPEQQRESQLDINSRANWLELAEIQVLLYTDATAASARLQTFLGPQYAIVAVDNDQASNFPGYLIAVSSGQTVVIVSGTTTPQQLALQVFLGGRPTVYGSYTTHALHWTAANNLETAITAAGADPAAPIVLVGHSYGGAVACILAADYRLNRPDRQIRLLTYGAPRTFDSRGRAILARVEQVHLADEGDPVPALPPDTDVLIGLSLVVPSPLLDIWQMVEAFDVQKIVQANGHVIDSQVLPCTVALIYALIASVLVISPIAPIVPHQMTTYRNRLLNPP